MKVLYIALKDSLRSFRSAFLLVMMFVAPLLITAILYFAFRGAGSGLALPVTRLQVVDLDRPDGRSGLAAGRMLSEYLQDPGLASLVQVSLAMDEPSARRAVDRREADVAVIIPATLTQAVLTPEATATVTLYHDPTLSVQPGIVRVLIGEFLDGFNGTKIAIQVAGDSIEARRVAVDPAILAQAEQRYIAWVQRSDHAHEGDSAHAQGASEVILAQRSPQGGAREADLVTGMLGPVMAGMMILFAFFTGASGASSLIYEDEGGTLARLFTTPTSRTTILGGKFLAVCLTVIVQVGVLLLASALVFDIRWGNPWAVALAVLALAVAAPGFGVFLMSFIRTARQAGPLMGGVVAVTGILGGLMPTGDPSQPGLFDTIGLIVPQGWAMRTWKLALAGAGAGEVLVPVCVLLVIGVVLFALGVLGFRKRFA